MSDVAVLLTPGAGSSRDHTSLVAIEVALAPHVVERLDFPYRIAGRRAPDRAPVLLAHIRTAAEELVARAGVPADRLVLARRPAHRYRARGTRRPHRGRRWPRSSAA